MKLSKIKIYIKIIWKTIYTISKYSVRILHLIRTTTINILLFVSIATIIIIYTRLWPSELMSNNTALILNLTGIIVDKPITSYSKIQKISHRFLHTNKANIQENSLFDIIKIIRQAKDDSNITGLILLLKNFSGSNQASLEYVGKALSEFKNNGKIIYAISDYYNQSQYFLASYANKIYLTPQGSVDLRGISTNKLYYKSLLDNLKIHTHIFRVGAYKSAVEPFIRNNMSDQVRNEEKKWVNQLWQQYLTIISTNREITNQQMFPGIEKILNDLHHMKGDTANYALNNKWIDEIASYYTIEEKMKKIFGSNKQGTSFNSISMYDYALINSIEKKNQIAIICINGAICNSSDISGSINGDTVIQKIRNARFNPKIKAIILRINSPGGSVNASERIRLELIATRNSGKPIIVSMGGIAASGGYWIATPANVIIASKSTLTGSIGIFGIINTFEESFNQIGIHSDGINTSPIANVSMTNSLPIEYSDMMQLYVDTSYHYFVNTVASSRNKSIHSTDQIAQGHVWLGSEAIKNGLIDNIGDFDDAIKKAAKLSHLIEYQLNWFEDKSNWIDLLFQKNENVINISIFKLIDYLMQSYNIHNKTNFNNTEDLKIFWDDPKHCYALCPNYIQYN